jgi:hypothetical protein
MEDVRPEMYAGLDSVIVRMAIAGRLVRAIVSREALETRFQAGHSPDDWLQAYRANADAINAVVKGKVDRASPEPIMVSKHDF